MLQLNKNQKRQPIGGHHFFDHNVTFKGNTFKEVVDDVVAFRSNNNIPAGNPEQDVLIFYAKNWPYMVEQSKVVEVKLVKNQDYNDWRDFIYKAWKNPPLKFLTIKEAQERWDVCLKCPFHKKKNWSENSESLELSKRQFLLRRGMTIPPELGFCALHRADLGVSVFADGPASLSSKKENENYEKCWVNLVP